MTIDQRSKAIYIYAVSFIFKLIGISIYILLIFMKPRDTIYTEFDQYTIINIIGNIFYIGSFIFEIVSFFWVNSRISDYKKRLLTNNKNDNSSFNHYVFNAILFSLLTFILPIPFLSTIVRQRNIKKNITQRKQEKLIFKIEQKYPQINNFILSESFKKEILTYLLGYFYLINIGIIMTLITEFGFNNEPPLLFLIIVGSLSMLSIANVIFLLFNSTSKRRKILEYMYIKNIEVDPTITKLIKSFSILVGITYIVRIAASFNRNSNKYISKYISKNYFSFIIAIFAIFYSIILIRKILKWQLNYCKIY